MTSGCPLASLNSNRIKCSHNLQARLLRPVGHAACQRPFILRHRNRTFCPVRAVNKDEGQLAVQSPLKRLQTRLLGASDGALSTGCIICISFSVVLPQVQFFPVSCSLSLVFCRTSGTYAAKRGQGTQLQSGCWSVRCCIPDMLHRQSLHFSGNRTHGRAVWLVRLCQRSHQQLFLSWLHHHEPYRYIHAPKPMLQSQHAPSVLFIPFTACLT